MSDKKPIMKDGQICCPECGTKVRMNFIITDMEYDCPNCSWFYYSEV